LLTELTDAELMRRAAHGNADAFGELYDRRCSAIFRFALQTCGRREVAEEIAQDTFVMLTRCISSYDEERGTVTAFLFGIARNLLLRRVERDREDKLRVDERLDLKPATGPGPLDTILRSEALERIRRAVLDLPASYREAVVLCDLQELSYAEAAGVIGCPIGTVRSKLNRGRAMLAERLQSRKRCFV
jgi:RNA polymerase sigma-70 factor (ECF subfamily)